MNKTTVSILFAIFGLMSTNALSRGNVANFPPPHLASIELHTNFSNGCTAYLILCPFLDSLRKIDSSQADSNGIMKFRFNADPNSWYKIEVNGIPLVYGCFALGDSIILESNHGSLKVLYDRIGAFKMENEFYFTFGVKKDLFPFFQDTNCSILMTINDSIKKELINIHDNADSVAKKFPEHVYFVKDLRRWSNIFETFVFTILYKNFEISSSAVCNQKASSLLDTFDFHLKDDYMDPLDYYQMITYVIDGKYAKLKREDSSCSANYGLNTLFNLATRFNGYSRDLAFIRISELSQEAASIALLPFYQRMLDTMLSQGRTPKIYQILTRKNSLLLGRTPGSHAADIVLPDSNNIIYLLSNAKGKVILLHFWGTWCGPCLRELPSISKFEQKIGSDTNVVCINVALENHNFGGWKKFLSRHNLPGIDLYSEGLWQSDAAEKYDIVAVPANVIIGKQGRIVDAYIGRSSIEDDLKNDIEVAEKE